MWYLQLENLNAIIIIHVIQTDTNGEYLGASLMGIMHQYYGPVRLNIGGEVPLSTTDIPITLYHRYSHHAVRNADIDLEHSK